MNDFGTFQAIEQTVTQDTFLNGKIQHVVTEVRPEMRAPYILVNFTKSQVDLMCAIQSALVDCDIMIISDYCGEQEIQDLMSRLDLLLQTQVHPVQPRSLEARGHAVFKKITEKKIVKESVRKGTLSYQIKILI